MVINTAAGGVLPLASLNHISLVCRSLESSLSFYKNVLGFTPIRRPGSFDFDGAWLFNYGIGIHLLQAEDPPESAAPAADKAEIKPRDNHISFTCESMDVVQRRLKEMGIRSVQRRVEEGGVHVDQLFFHDPDGFMIEVCTCDNLPVVPLLMAPDDGKRVITIARQHHQTTATAAVAPATELCVTAKATGGGGCVAEVVDDTSARATRACPEPEHLCVVFGA